ncbi:MAG: ABC transporter ATP-binding protein [Chitinophagaceae bacterium]|nr:ABC transporter ATP-binding protein [Chitinophagaceae bacterium]
MKHLSALNKYFWKYRWRFLFGILFTVLSNYFRILAPQLTAHIIDSVEKYLPGYMPRTRIIQYDPAIQYVIDKIGERSFGGMLMIAGSVLLALAFLSGIFLFFMRQAIIVMSRHIEFDQKNEIYTHYQKLDAGFYKRHSTGDLMNRITEDVSRVRQYTGPAIMYFINLAATIGFCVFYMWQKDARLTLYVLSPLPVLAITIYYVNNIINKKSEQIQGLLSDLTTSAQESYSGIRVIKSFVQEKAMAGFFGKFSEDYRKNALSLAKVESVYFPSMSLMIGLSTLLTILIGGIYSLHGDPDITTGTIAEFVLYVNMLTFPVSAIGLTASMTQRAATSQRRINEFLNIRPIIQDPAPAKKDGSEYTTAHEETFHKQKFNGDISFKDVNFIYPDTGIHAIKNFSLEIGKGEKIAVIGRTGSGKTTLAQLMLRMYDPMKGSISIDGINIDRIKLRDLREQISYVPQDVFLFSDSVTKNIEFGLSKPSENGVVKAARHASVDNEIRQFSEQYETVVGERGVTLSGGQKQRISIARALIKDPQIVIFDDCLSAVDAKTEREIIGNLYNFLEGKTSIIITHRIFSMFDFDRIIVLEHGEIIEQGTHQELLSRKGYYAHLYGQQQ